MQTPPPLPPSPSPLDDFRRSALRSGLMNDADIDAALAALPPEQGANPGSLAEHLIYTGKLTRFQARKLLEGRSKGLLLGSFQILSPIGKGSYGTVYLARDTRNGLLVALKVIAVSQVEPRVRARFLREMEMSRMVEHPFLARAYETGHLLGADFIAMEFIPGRSLSRLVQQEAPLSVPRAASIFREVALALEHVHARGLIHRDIKPSNIMITPHDHAKVLDLGLALLAGEVGDPAILGGAGYIVGTMDYISPEQTADPSKVDPRTDLYSLGCALYFALCGHPPFPGGTRREKILRHRTSEPVLLTELHPEIPLAFSALVRKLMAKDPADRYPNAAAVVEALAPWSATPTQTLDRPDDPTYAEAVAALQAIYGSDSYSDLALLDASEPLAIASAPAAPAMSGWTWMVFGLVVAVAAGLLIPILVMLSGQGPR